MAQELKNGPTHPPDWPRKLLVPVTSAEDCRRLMPVVESIGGLANAQVVVLSVIEVGPDENVTEDTPLVRELRQEIHAEIEKFDFRNVDVAVRIRVSDSAARSIAETCREEGCDLLLFDLDQASDAHGSIDRQFESLLLHPPCDLIALRLAGSPPFDRVLLGARGGPQPSLGVQISALLQRPESSHLTLLHIDQLDKEPARRNRSLTMFEDLVNAAKQIEGLEVTVHQKSGSSPADALLEEALNYDLLIMGGAANREAGPEHPLGEMAARLLSEAPSSVMILRTAAPIDPDLFDTPGAQLGSVIDHWFAENTFEGRDYQDIDRLVALKKSRGMTISVVLPALNEASTVGKVIQVLKSELQERHPLIDEIVVIDGGSNDKTRKIARAEGVPVFRQHEILPDLELMPGKGDAMWKSLFVTTGDIIVAMDADIKNIHPKFIYGVVGPLLTEPRLRYVCGFYHRSIRLGGVDIEVGGDRVNELTARPLLNLFYPELSGLIEPASRETAAFRSALERISFSPGYGVEIGNLIDIYEEEGLTAIGQVALEQRIHRENPLASLTERSVGLTQVVINRIERRENVSLIDPKHSSLKRIQWRGNRYSLDVRNIISGLRPPMVTIPEYIEKFGATASKTD